VATGFTHTPAGGGSSDTDSSDSRRPSLPKRAR
jgi:hypothetical protein